MANFVESEHSCVDYVRLFVEWVHFADESVHFLKSDLDKLNERTSLDRMTEMGLCG
ncbi:hypothetical protein JCM19037_4072 [Geomicrobium sp. JCM 19037]|uniref:hypothetical protein n=1 Tax=Geomicrobium sp. JCM 19037 TaxID=1460634 RepID=UPI00045F105F|nr:hypothetical protein [Geomicrobium sp. JCM 19037]GAK05564.1 hypothetical protein JCM19037_4072 [Geomicrobium sp. JCM 19037]